MTGETSVWRTDDPCPLCGTGLTAITDAAGTDVGQDCPLCGWSTSWQADMNLDTRGEAYR
jgi:hypothetical protein